MPAIKANLFIDQGSTFSTIMNFSDEDGIPLDLTSYDGRAQLRRHYESNTAVSFDVTLGGVEGTIQLEMSANTTAALTPGRNVYDCELISGNTVIRFVEGNVTVLENVTR